MISYIVYHLQTGKIMARNRVSYESQVGLGISSEFGTIVGEATPNSYVDIATQNIVPQPTVPEFNTPYDLTVLPNGTVVKITDESGIIHEIPDLSEALILEGPQTYRVQVNPPFPYIGVDTTVEIL